MKRKAGKKRTFGIMKSIFSVATRRDPRESVGKFLRRGGGLKMYWTEPAAEEFLYGY